MPNNALVEVGGIAKRFRVGFLRRSRLVLHDLALEVVPGEIFGFLGANGAGKTTTIKILLGLIHPDDGSGHVLGQPFGSVRARHALGYLPDSPNSYSYLTACELLRFTGRLHGLHGAELARTCETVLTRVGLEQEAWNRPLKTYSRGMLQRTGIAAAILHRPRLLILDEPMNGLDPRGRREFRDLLLELRGQGTTVFFSSHVLADIEATADRVGILSQGRLIRCGPLRDILAGGRRQVEINFTLPVGAALSELARTLENLQETRTGWRGWARDEEVANGAVARIQAAGGKLLGYQPRRESLEDFFLREISSAITDARLPQCDRRRSSSLSDGDDAGGRERQEASPEKAEMRRRRGEGAQR